MYPELEILSAKTTNKHKNTFVSFICFRKSNVQLLRGNFQKLIFWWHCVLIYHFNFSDDDPNMDMLKNLLNHIRKRPLLIGGIIIIVIIATFLCLFISIRALNCPPKPFHPMVQSNGSFTDDGVKKVKLPRSHGFVYPVPHFGWSLKE